jgi:hypothetical protein
MADERLNRPALVWQLFWIGNLFEMRFTLKAYYKQLQLYRILVSFTWDQWKAVCMVTAVYHFKVVGWIYPSTVYFI